MRTLLFTLRFLVAVVVLIACFSLFVLLAFIITFRLRGLLFIFLLFHVVLFQLACSFFAYVHFYYVCLFICPHCILFTGYNAFIFSLQLAFEPPHLMWKNTEKSYATFNALKAYRQLLCYLISEYEK